MPKGIKVDNFHIGDYWQHGVLHLTAAGVIAKSSNLGTIVAARQMTKRSHWYVPAQVRVRPEDGPRAVR